MKLIILLVLVLTFISKTQALECAVGFAQPDAQGHIPANPTLLFMTCTTQCLVAFVKTAQEPTGSIAASCAADDSTACDGYVLDVNTWGEVKCCSTDRCNGPTGNFPWDGYNWAAPRNPFGPTSTSTSSSSTTNGPVATNAPLATEAPTTTTTTTAPGPTIQCTVGTSVPDGQGGVIKQVTTQSCTQCFAIYTHSSVGPQNVGTIVGGCASASSTTDICNFRGTVVTQPNQWAEIKCCDSGNNCNSQDWGAGQYDWTTPRTSSTVTGITGIPGITSLLFPTIGAGGAGIATATGTGTGVGSGNPTTNPTQTQPPTGQPISGNTPANTVSSTGTIHHGSATSLHVSPLFLVVLVAIMMSIMF